MADTPVIDYTKREYESNKTALIAFIKERFPTDWTDFFDSNLGVALLEANVYDFTILSFMLDKMANEGYLETAQLRENVLRIVNLIGYNVSAATASSISVNAELTSVQLDDVVIREGTEIRTIDGLVFEVSQDYTVTAGNLTPMSLEVAADVSRTVTFTENSIIVTFNIPLPADAGLGDSIRATSGPDTEFHQIVDISADRLEVTLDAIWVAATTTAEYEVYDRQIILIQGESKTESFVSNGEANQVLLTTEREVIDGSMTVEVNSVEWSEVESLIYATASQQAYELSFDSQDRAIIRFGDNISGKIPPDGLTIDLDFRIGGGEVGNVAKNAIRTTISGYVGASSTVSVSVSNPVTQGSGGQDRETIEHIKEFAPRYVRTNDRAVTAEDYQTLSASFSDETFGSVAQAVAVLNTNLVPKENNLVYVYIWAPGPNGTLVAPSDGLRSTLKTYLDEKKMIGTEILVVAGASKDVDVTAVVGYDTSFNTAEVTTNIEAAIDDVFEDPNLLPGTPLYISKIYEAVEAIQGVDHVYISTSPASVDGQITTESYEVISKGTVSIEQTPVAPDWFAVPSTSTGNFTIQWSAVSAISGYQVQESADSAFTTPTLIYDGTATELNLTRATGKYYYRVRTYNSFGTSPWRLANNPCNVL